MKYLFIVTVYKYQMSVFYAYYNKKGCHYFNGKENMRCVQVTCWCMCAAMFKNERERGLVVRKKSDWNRPYYLCRERCMNWIHYEFAKVSRYITITILLTSI